MVPTLSWLTDPVHIWRMDPDDEPAVPQNAGPLTSITRTANELSVVTGSGHAPEGARVSGPWHCFRVQGTLNHDLTGILSGISRVLADASIPIFAVSTFDTDYVLVPAERRADATTALTAAGYPFDPS